MNAKAKSKRFNIAIVSSPTELSKQTSEANIAAILDILMPLSNRLFLLAGSSPYTNEKVQHIKVKRWRDKVKDFILLKIISRFLTDLKITFHLLRIANQIDLVIYYLGVKGYLISMLVMRLLRKRIVVCSFSSMPRTARIMRKEGSTIWDSAIPPTISNTIERLTFALSHRIWAETEQVIIFSGLDKYKSKVFACRMFFVDVTHFLPRTKLKERGNIVGYLGRFDELKGVQNLAKAIPIILENSSEVEFLMAGDGSLWQKVNEAIKRGNLHRKVKLIGEIPRGKVADYLNKLKLLVLCSYSEGLPNVVQEAMACGTPVLATPVGGIPDLIKDGKNGFIMEDNSPECIAENVIRALNHPNLEQIAHNARKLMEEEYTLDVVVEECQRALNKLV